MKKQLIGAHNIDDFINPDTSSLCVDAGMILSPGAKDILRNKGVTIVYGEVAKKSDVNTAISSDITTKETKHDSQVLLIKKIANMLSNEYGIKEEKQLRTISLQVMRKLNQQ